MRNLILILLLVLFFAFIYLLMSGFWTGCAKGICAWNSSGRILIGKYRTKMILSIDLRKNPFYDGNQKNHARIWKDPAL